MLKKLACFIFFFLLSAKNAWAEIPNVLIINQIRGTDICCSPGTLELPNRIYADNSLAQLHMGWALRYDALRSSSFVDFFQNKQELGLLLEVTPKLTDDSGVIYKGARDGTDWYLSKNAFLIGYSPDERIKIIDTAFSAFYNTFGYYPSFTVGWMIDAWSLKYIDQTYHTKLHELTKEQYETDSYTLYGGIFNAPYYPSVDHPLIPGSDSNKLNLLIVRQTISDPLYNYGSDIAQFTSQPNDYLNNTKHLDSTYFDSLINSILIQNGEGRFGLIGLENSISSVFYDEYIRQLNLLLGLNQNKKIDILFPSFFALNFQNRHLNNPPVILTKSFSPAYKKGVLWYFGKTYRARIIMKNGQIILDDLRIFGNITDPYKITASTGDYSYWVVPYLFDASQQFSLTKEQKSSLSDKTGSIPNIVSDFNSSPFGIVLGTGKFRLKPNPTNATIEFPDLQNGKVIFTPTEMQIDKKLDVSFTYPYPSKLNEIISRQEDKIFHFNRQYDFAIHQDKDITSLGWQTDVAFIKLADLTSSRDVLHLTPATAIPNLELLNPILQPDRSDTPIDSRHSIFYWNNTSAVAGRNPVRLFILPLNFLGRPTKIGNITIDFENNVKPTVTLPQDYSYKIKPWFIDISSSTPLQTNMSLNIDGINIIKNKPLRFIPDCRKNFKMCLTHPIWLLQYTFIQINDKVKQY